MKYITLIIAFLLFSCGKKEDVLLPKSDISIVKNVQDHSPIYIFFKTEGKDTIADVNRTNSIISTNWIFNIDRRLPLKLVIHEVRILQEKKRADSAHKNEKAENYYSYADSIGKNLAFLPFTKLYYSNEYAKNSSELFLKKNGIVQYTLKKDYYFPKKDLPVFLDSLAKQSNVKIVFSFDKNMSYGEYIQYKIFLEKLNSKQKEFINKEEEFVF